MWGVGWSGRVVVWSVSEMVCMSVCDGVCTGQGVSISNSNCICDTYHFLLRFFYLVIQYKFDLILKLPNYLIQQLSPHLMKLFKKLDKSVEQKCALHIHIVSYIPGVYVNLLNINKMCSTYSHVYVHMNICSTLTNLFILRR